MKKTMIWVGIAACLGLNACTALTSTNHASSSTQLHDTRMRMRHGELAAVNSTNYGTYAMMEEQHATTSVPANTNTTMWNESPAAATDGNVRARTMTDAPMNEDPSNTAGNMRASTSY